MKYHQPWNPQPPFGPVADPNAPYINANPSAGIEGSAIPAEAIELPQREIVAAVELAGFASSDEDLTQLTRGIRQGTGYGTATVISGGDPNMLYLTLNPRLDTYRYGLELHVKIPVENTGPVAVKIDDLPLRNVVRANGAVLAAGDLKAGMVAAFVDDGNVFQLVNFQGFTADITNENTYIVNVPYCVDLGSANHIIAPFSPPVSSLAAGFFCFVKIAAPNTGRTFISVNGMPEVELVRTDLGALGPQDIVTGMVCGMVYDGAKFQMVSFPASILRDLIAPMSYYVATTGSDSNDGLTPATPFRHIQYAIDRMMRWNNRGTTFTIHIADGQYEERVICPTINGSGSCYLRGNIDSPQNCVVWDHIGSSGYSNAITTVGHNYHILGLKFLSDYGGGLAVTVGTCYVGHCEFGYCGRAHLACLYGGQCLYWGETPGTIRVSGATQNHIYCSNNSYISMGAGAAAPAVTVVITTPITVTHWVFADTGAAVGIDVAGISGAGNVISGYKFGAVTNSIISSVQVLPGTLPGYTNSGGVYQGP